MKEILLLQGKKFSVFAIELDDDNCPATDFLDKVEQNNKPSHKTLLHLIKWHADCGPIKNEKKSKKIDGFGNLLEFKSSQGDRLVYFYCAHGKTVLTSGFHKGTHIEAQIEYKKAKQMRDRYFKEVDNG